jgi:phosphatidate cytidylyltransferase
MKSELVKRITTSFLLLTLLSLMYFYTYIFIISLVIVALIAWIEFNNLITKIFKNKNQKKIIIKFIFKSISLLYLSLLVFVTISIVSTSSDMQHIFFYSLLVSIMSDIGGLIVGKTFKGRKLTKISPNKTISGSLGSIIFSLFLVPIFISFFTNYNLFLFCLMTIIISLTSQIGDLLISFFKRKAKVKNTSNLLPGHGGVLDRIDGAIFAIPIGLLVFKLF